MTETNFKKVTPDGQPAEFQRVQFSLGQSQNYVSSRHSSQFGGSQDAVVFPIWIANDLSLSQVFDLSGKEHHGGALKISVLDLTKSYSHMPTFPS